MAALLWFLPEKIAIETLPVCSLHSEQLQNGLTQPFNFLNLNKYVPVLYHCMLHVNKQ